MPLILLQRHLTHSTRLTITRVWSGPAAVHLKDRLKSHTSALQNSRYRHTSSLYIKLLSSCPVSSFPNWTTQDEVAAGSHFRQGIDSFVRLFWTSAYIHQANRVNLWESIRTETTSDEGTGSDSLSARAFISKYRASIKYFIFYYNICNNAYIRPVK